jgi:tetratricopeptide (TPR) repeat protein
MTSELHFADRLDTAFAPAERALLIRRLRYEPALWQALEEEKFFEAAHAFTGSAIERWRPGLLGLLLAGDTAALRAITEAKAVNGKDRALLSPEYEKRALAALDSIRDGGELDLSSAALAAAALVARSRGMESLMQLAAPPRVVLACAYSLGSSPAQFANAVWAARAPQARLVVQSLLANEDTARAAQLLGEWSTRIEPAMWNALLDAAEDLGETDLARALASHSPAPAAAAKSRTATSGAEGSETAEQVMLSARVDRALGRNEASRGRLAKLWEETKRAAAKVGMELAHAAEEEGDWVTALAAWQEAHLADPDLPAVRAGLAKSLLKLTRADEALSVLAPQPADAEEALAMAQTHLALGHLPQACEFARQAVNKAGAAKPRRLMEEAYSVLAKSGEPLQAAQAAREVARLRPAHAASHLELARLEAQCGDWQRSREAAHIAAQLDPANAEALRASAVASEHLGQSQHALSAWKRMRELAPEEDEALLGIGRSGLAAGQPTETEEAAGALLAKNASSGEALALIGRARMAQGNLAGAEEAFQRATKVAPASPAPWKALADYHEAKGDTSAAIATLRAGIDAASDAGELLLALGQIAFRQGENAEAVQMLERAAEHMPGATLVLTTLALALLRLGNLREAEARVREALRLAPASLEALRALGETLIAQGRNAEARRVLEQAVRLYPTVQPLLLDLARLLVRMAGEDASHAHEHATAALAIVQRARELVDPAFALELDLLQAEATLLAGHAHEARDLFTQALQQIETNARDNRLRALAGLARALLALGEPAAAIANLQSALQLTPNDRGLLALLAEAFEKAGLLEDARATLEQLLTLAPTDGSVLRALANVFAALGNVTKSIDLLRQACDANPNDASSWAALAERLLHAGQAEEARQAMARAIECAAPFAGEIAYRAAQFMMTLKQYAEAALLIQRALENDPRDTALISTLGEAMQKSARYPEAVEAFARAAELEPDEISHLTNAAESLWEDGRRAAAMAYWRKALAVDPHSAWIHRRMAIALAEDGAFEEAVTHFEEALSASPQDVDLARDASRAAIRAGRLEQAEAWLSRVLQDQPDSKEALRLKAGVDIAAGHSGEAIAAAQRLVDDDPHDGLAWALLAQAHVRIGELHESASAHPARVALRHALVHGADSAEALNVAADAALALEDYPAAMNCLATLRRMQPEDFRHHLAFARAAVQRAEACTRWEAAHGAMAAQWQEAVDQNARENAIDALAHAEALGAAEGEVGSLRPRIEAAFAPVDSGILATLHQLTAEEPQVEIHLALSRARLVAEDFTGALEAAKAALALDQANPIGNMLLGLAHWRMGQRTLALEALQNAQRVAAYQPLPHALAALVQAEAGDLRAASTAMTAALAADDSIAAWEQLAGEWHESLGNLEAALAHYQRASELAPEDGGTLARLARALRKDGDAVGALIHYRRAASLIDPLPASLMAELAEAALAAGEAGEAAEAYRNARNAAASTPPVDWVLGEARAEQRLGHGDQARTLADQAMHSPSHRAEAHMVLADADETAGDLESACKHLEQAATLAKDTFEPTLRLAQLWTLTGKADRALTALERLAVLRPESSVVKHAQAEALAKLGRDDEALKAAQSATELEPRRAAGWMLQGKIARKIGQMDQAMAALSRARELDPRDWKVGMELGLAMEAQKRWDLAQEAYRGALQVNPNSSDLNYRLGVALKNLRAYGESAEALRRAVQLNPSNLAAHKLLSAVLAIGLVYNAPTLAAQTR